MLILLEQVTSLCRRNAPVESIWLRRVLYTTSAETGRVHRERGAGG